MLWTRDVQSPPALTVYEGEWAYCQTGGTDEHDWRLSIQPSPFEKLLPTPHGSFVLCADRITTAQAYAS